jgi:hypothetical protein
MDKEARITQMQEGVVKAGLEMSRLASEAAQVSRPQDHNVIEQNTTAVARCSGYAWDLHCLQHMLHVSPSSCHAHAYHVASHCHQTC